MFWDICISNVIINVPWETELAEQWNLVIPIHHLIANHQLGSFQSTFDVHIVYVCSKLLSGTIFLDEIFAWLHVNNKNVNNTFPWHVAETMVMIVERSLVSPIPPSPVSLLADNFLPQAGVCKKFCLGQLLGLMVEEGDTYFWLVKWLFVGGRVQFWASLGPIPPRSLGIFPFALFVLFYLLVSEVFLVIRPLFSLLLLFEDNKKCFLLLCYSHWKLAL